MPFSAHLNSVSSSMPGSVLLWSVSSTSSQASSVLSLSTLKLSSTVRTVLWAYISFFLMAFKLQKGIHVSFISFKALNTLLRINTLLSVPCPPYFYVSLCQSQEIDNDVILGKLGALSWNPSQAGTFSLGESLDPDFINPVSCLWDGDNHSCCLAGLCSDSVGWGASGVPSRWQVLSIC